MDFINATNALAGKLDTVMLFELKMQPVSEFLDGKLHPEVTTLTPEGKANFKVFIPSPKKEIVERYLEEVVTDPDSELRVQERM
jgi:hypothetical protein